MSGIVLSSPFPSDRGREGERVRMAVKYIQCEQCHRWDITGFISCKNKQLCPDCSAPILKAKPGEVRHALWDKLFEDVESLKGGK